MADSMAPDEDRRFERQPLSQNLQHWERRHYWYVKGTSQLSLDGYVRKYDDYFRLRHHVQRTLSSCRERAHTFNLVCLSYHS